ncbi:hypothetical protein [Neobacillus massiliamazoniensis]|uniref:Uncharacterized protein n=1 Tax=Neobacillus massiliamazoniensis TaxID=1499688 RepID=A0A0U1NXZ6_9BACI|nr:hypothetical protein [Neobacillus massiliamazoniensis]CRK82901.1 hypothetical protein BN000_02856 [Neobacillus massiliamazoniensis]
MQSQQFDIETLKLIRNKLEYIYFIAKSNYNNHPELMDTIENLAQVANMFANIRIHELNDRIEISSPEGFIVSKLANAYSRMKDYEIQKDSDFPTWKL